MCGVDFTRIDSLYGTTTLGVISAIGSNRNRLLTIEHLVHFVARLVYQHPNHRRHTDGKVLSGKTTRVVGYAAQFLRMTAAALHTSKSALRAYFHGKYPRTRQPKAVTVTESNLLIYSKH
jgi:hypothetical protein